MTLAEEIAIALGPPTLSPMVRSHWERIYARYCQMIWRALRRMGYSPEVAADAAQQAFLISVQRAGDVREGLEKAFLFSTAIRVAKRMVQKERRLELLPDPESAQVPSSGSPIDERQHAIFVFDCVLRQMDEDLRAVFVLFELEEQTTREIAEWLGIPLGTVASRLRRARERFRDLTLRLEPDLGLHPSKTERRPISEEDA